MSNAKIAQLIKNTDALVSNFESKNIKAVESAMDAAFRQLEKEFRRKWISLESQDLAGRDRAILLINDIQQYMQLLPSNSTVEKLYEDLVKDCNIAGIAMSGDAIATIQGFSAATVKPNMKAIAYQSRDSANRLRRHSEDFRLRASQVIEQGLVGGSGVGKVAEQLRRELGLTKAKAETIARTESMSAIDSASRDTYKANGIEYVQRIGTQDKRICPTCAARVGNVYPVDKAQAVIHPRDRCYMMPFAPAWVDLGLVDMKWLQNHRQESIAALGDKAPNYGPSPFEMMAGQSAPKPFWTVDKGFTDPPKVEKKSKANAPKTNASKKEPKKASKKDAFPSSLDGLKEIKRLGGSTGAVLVEDSNGNRFVKKAGASPEHLMEESKADLLYAKMGLAVPEHKIYKDSDGIPVKLARFIEGQSFGDLSGDAKTAAMAELKKGFAIDALMGNWDVLGMDGDNVLVDKNGKVWRIDNGGSLRYRAQGQPKGDAWNKYPTELWSLRDGSRNGTQAPSAFSGMDWYDVVDQIDAVKLPRFSKDDKELGDMLKLRLAEMQRSAAISKTMKDDQWRSSYVEQFTKHGMGYRAAGIVDMLADSMEIKTVQVDGNYLDTPVDSKGVPYDNIRHSSVRGDIQQYYKDNNLDYSVTEDYRQKQGNSSWSRSPLALKSLIARSRSVDGGDYRWQSQSNISNADQYRADLSQKYPSWSESMIAMHAWTYEQLNKIKMPNIDQKNGTITVWRTEGDYLHQAMGGQPKKDTLVKYGTIVRGAAESTSLFTPIVASAGGIVTRQTIPIHRIFADYMLQREGRASGFLMDEENEAVAILDGIDFEVLPAKSVGHTTAYPSKSIPVYDSKKGLVTPSAPAGKKGTKKPPKQQPKQPDPFDLLFAQLGDDFDDLDNLFN